MWSDGVVYWQDQILQSNYDLRKCPQSAHDFYCEHRSSDIITGNQELL